jgi:tRNA-binding EMAP/Myf-like protein
VILDARKGRFIVENNKAFVAFLRNIEKIEGADNIVKADVVLHDCKIAQVVVGADTVENTGIIYFDSNMVLSDRVMLDWPLLGTYTNKGRIRVVKLRGCISNGMAVEVEKFFPYFSSKEEALSTLVEGHSFTEIRGIEVCHKYLPPMKIQSFGKQSNKKGHTISRMIDGQFHFHIDTSQLLRNIHKLNPASMISISRKVNGTSAIASNCLVRRKLSLVEKALHWLGVSIEDTEYDMIYSSRSVVKNGALSSGFYKVDVWTEAGKKYFEGKLHKGETVYYEIVGYLPSTSTMIQKGYNYGCDEGEYKIAVYRITSTNRDGLVTEYSWAALKERCNELNVPMVEEYYFGRARYLFDVMDNDAWATSFVERLKSQYLEKICADCEKKVYDEGIVLRVEGLYIEVYKLKSEGFLLGESKVHEEEVDIEEGA